MYTDASGRCILRWPGLFMWLGASCTDSCWIVICELTLKVLNFWKFTCYFSLKPLWSGMGEVLPARTSPTHHPHPSHCASIVMINCHGASIVSILHVFYSGQMKSMLLPSVSVFSLCKAVWCEYVKINKLNKNKFFCFLRKNNIQ